MLWSWGFLRATEKEPIQTKNVNLAPNLWPQHLPGIVLGWSSIATPLPEFQTHAGSLKQGALKGTPGSKGQTPPLVWVNVHWGHQVESLSTRWHLIKAFLPCSSHMGSWQPRSKARLMKSACGARGSFITRKWLGEMSQMTSSNSLTHQKQMWRGESPQAICRQQEVKIAREGPPDSISGHGPGSGRESPE